MNKYKILLALFLFIAGCKQENKYIEYFKNGQIIMPEAKGGDTLIVYDARGLNVEVGKIEQGGKYISLQGIDSIFNKHCLTIKFLNYGNE